MKKYKVSGALYGEDSRYYSWDAHREFPYYDRVSEDTWEIEAESLENAVTWFKKNHPDMVQGGSVSRILENEGDKPEFYMFAIPNAEYGYGNFETVENRIEWALGSVA